MCRCSRAPEQLAELLSNAMAALDVQAMAAPLPLSEEESPAVPCQLMLHW